MDKLAIDFKNLLPYVIYAFKKIYGEEYEDIILKRIYNSTMIQYYDIEGLRDYILNIRNCKKRELSIKFLYNIGLDVEKHIKDNYTKPLDKEIESILEYYIDSPSFGFSNDTDYWVPLQSFKSNNMSNSKKLLENKLKIINYLRSQEHEKITEENFDSFSKTEEYQEILNKINELNNVYEPLLLEFRKFEEKLQPYKDFIKRENTRKDEILEKRKQILFLDIYPKLPKTVMNALSKKTTEEKIVSVLGDYGISETSVIESFSNENMKKLNSKDVSYFNKFLIINSQISYLKNIGIDIPDENIVNSNLTEEDIDNYLSFLKQDNVKNYIPSNDLISYISSTREKYYEKAIEEYYTTREDFINITKNQINGDENTNKYVYNQIKNKKVFAVGCTIDYNKFSTVIFYTIRTFDMGNLFWSFMHECGHVIDMSLPKCSGFDYINFTYNSYDNAYRKYERFNETINDIFTNEALQLLQSQGLYLIEPKEFTSLDENNNNTSLIVKNILRPLIDKYREYVIKAKINSNHDELTKYIGEDNFEELVDAVNKVDYLSRNGVISKIETSKDDEMVIEYYKELERVKKIYENMDSYYFNNFKHQK